MEKNDPLIESAINIMEELNKYKENMNTLNNRIASQEEDQAELENCLSMMKMEAEKVKSEIDELEQKRIKIITFKDQIDSYQTKIQQEYQNLFSTILKNSENLNQFKSQIQFCLFDDKRN